jgi:hypothetical protein
MLEEADELERYRLKFAQLSNAALSPSESRVYFKENG